HVDDTPTAHRVELAGLAGQRQRRIPVKLHFPRVVGGGGDQALLLQELERPPAALAPLAVVVPVDGRHRLPGSPKDGIRRDSRTRAAPPGRLRPARRIGTLRPAWTVFKARPR